MATQPMHQKLFQRLQPKVLCAVTIFLISNNTIYIIQLKIVTYYMTKVALATKYLAMSNNLFLVFLKTLSILFFNIIPTTDD